MTNDQRKGKEMNHPAGATALKRRYGPTALVTGASDGIGRAFAEHLAEQGFDLILVARRETVLQDMARDLETRHGGRARVIALDLSDPSAVSDLLAMTEAEPVGLIVAAAGFGSVGPFLERNREAEIEMIDVNCRAVVDLTHGFGQRLRQQGRGGIVLFGSLVGFGGAPFSATYAATKSFVQSFAEGIALELRPIGVDVLSVAPGPVSTGFAARAGMQMGKAETPQTIARVSLGALGGRMTVRPGFLAKFLGWSLAMLPRWGRVRVLGLIMEGMMGKRGPRSGRGKASPARAKG